VSLGRSNCPSWGSFPCGRMHRRQEGVLWRNTRRGTSSACVKRTHSFGSPLHCDDALEETSFTRSRDPCTSLALFIFVKSERSGRYRGRANPRKWEEPAPGSERTRRRAARRVPPLPQGGQRGASEKEGGHGHRPCEDTRARVWLPVRRMQLQKSASSISASNKHVRSAPKRVAVRVNGNLANALRTKSEDSPFGGHRRKGEWGVGLHHGKGEEPA